ncbi:MAG: hypothetical protein AAGA48_28795 [Myxococcota bacterium]
MLAWLGWGWIAAAMAQNAAPEELIVEGHRLTEAKEALHQELKSRGYNRFLQLGPRRWYLNPKLWKPGVMIHEEGFARVRGRPIMPLSVRYMKRVAFRPSYVEGVFLLQSKGMRRTQKAELVRNLEPHLRAIRDARWAMVQPRREADLQAELARLWFDRLDTHGTYLEDRAQIREALFQRWLATATGEAGGAMRAIIDIFVVDVVQTSNDPFTTEECQDVRARIPSDREPPSWANRHDLQNGQR